MPFLRGISKENTKELMQEVHEGFCGDLTGGTVVKEDSPTRVFLAYDDRGFHGIH